MSIVMRPITQEVEYSELLSQASELVRIGVCLPSRVITTSYNIVGLIDTWGLGQIPLRDLYDPHDGCNAPPSMVVIGMGGGDYRRAKGVFPCYSSASMHGTPCDQLSEVLIEFPRKRDFPAVREHQEKLLAELRWFDSWAMFSMDGEWIIWGDCEFGVAICGVQNGEPLETLAASKYFSLRRSVVDPMVLANFSQGYEIEYHAFMQVMMESYSLADE